MTYIFFLLGFFLCKESLALVMPSSKVFTMMMESGEQGLRTYASYSLYKGKGAISMRPIPPTFSISGTARTVTKNGAMMFELAAAVGTREYDWKNKITFALDVTECGEFLQKATEGTGTGADFIHDPNMGSTQGGQITKRLKLQPMQDGKGIFMTLQLTDKAATVSSMVSVPVTWGEVKVMSRLIEYSIPHFLGFDCVWNNAMGGHSSDEKY